MPLQVLVGSHIALGLLAVISGAAAMLTPKRPGRHPRRGMIYLATLAGLTTTGIAIAVTDWTHLWHLTALGSGATILAALGYTARRIRWHGWLGWHITAMGGSYAVMLTAFYVDNGPRLPGWNLLPPLTFWFLPTAVALPLIIRALHRHVRVARRGAGQRSAPTSVSCPP